MNPNNLFNTLSVIAVIGLMIARTALRAMPTSPIGISLFGFMFLIILISIFKSVKIDRTDKKISIFMFIYLIIHFFTADTEITAIGLIILSFLLTTYLKRLNIDAHIIGQTIVLCFIATMILYFDSLVSNLFTTASNSSFRAFFDNANTTGAFTTIAITATFLFVKNKQLKVLLCILFAMSLLGCKSRNAVLFAITAMGFYIILKTKFAKYTPAIFVLTLLIALYYMAIIEPFSQTTQAQMFGKEQGSAGRSEQILITVTHFPLTLFGVGYDVPNDYSVSITTFAIHNFYINTIYALGILFTILYFWYISHIYKTLKSKFAKAFLLASHIYFMFEPGTGFSTGMVNSLPLILSVLKLNDENYENSTLHTKFQYRRS